MFLKNFWWSACAKSRLSGKRLIKVIVSSVHLNLKMSIPILIKFIFCFQSSSQYLLFHQENNELLMFTLKQLDQVTFHSNRYGSAPGIIEILEEEFLDRVSVLFYATFWGLLFVLAGSHQKFWSHAKGGTPEHPNIYTRKNAQVVTSPQTSCYKTVCSQVVFALLVPSLF